MLLCTQKTNRKILHNRILRFLHDEENTGTTRIPVISSIESKGSNESRNLFWRPSVVIVLVNPLLSQQVIYVRCGSNSNSLTSANSEQSLNEYSYYAVFMNISYGTFIYQTDGNRAQRSRNWQSLGKWTSNTMYFGIFGIFRIFTQRILHFRRIG